MVVILNKLREYVAQLQALLPQGKLWSRDRGSRMTTLLASLAEELATVDDRGEDLLREADPTQAVELLPEWEAMLGLPDPCVTTPQTTEQRRIAVVAKLTARGGQSKQFFIDLAAALGYAIEIEEHHPFVAGSLAGESLTNGDWVYTWTVHAPETTIQHFVAGSSAGEPLRTWGNDELECTLDRAKPAHTILQFVYDL